ncbi:MAG TPA: N-acetyltransferase [Phycisphaerae bacterium]|nr:N-acetyltransferase [Phycisphaerae bacterium]
MIRRAKITDVPRIAELISQHARRGKMLFRSYAELYETLRDFVVYELDEGAQAGLIVGTCALEIVWADLAEVKSLSVDENFQKKGIGRKLVEAVLDEARELRIQKVFALTYEPEFFAKFGFKVVEKSALPLKVWSDCVKCPKRDGCDEIAVVRELLQSPALADVSPDSLENLRYDVPTPLVKINIKTDRG